MKKMKLLVITFLLIMSPLSVYGFDCGLPIFRYIELEPQYDFKQVPIRRFDPVSNSYYIDYETEQIYLGDKEVEKLERGEYICVPKTKNVQDIGEVRVYTDGWLAKYYDIYKREKLKINAKSFRIPKNADDTEFMIIYSNQGNIMYSGSMKGQKFIQGKEKLIDPKNKKTYIGYYPFVPGTFSTYGYKEFEVFLPIKNLFDWGV